VTVENGLEGPVILAGDVGGTKTKLGLFAGGKSRQRLLAEETYESREARSLAALASRFLSSYDVSVSAACFGLPGPVSGDRARTTNLPWIVSGTALKRRFGWPRVFLLNDVAAMAHGIATLKKGETVPLSPARRIPTQTQALVAPGTGLGVSLLVRQGGDDAPTILATEGGHVDFAPSNEDEWDLRQYIHERFGHVSVERVLSGPGISLIHAWLRDSGRRQEPPWLAKRLQTGDPAKTIARNALKGKAPICTETLRRFASILGAVAGNAALTAMALGGVYLGGGIPPRILPILQEGGFLEAFVSKGRFRPLLEKIAVRVILCDRIALQGAARFAFLRTP